jgi:hypothetical protein
MRKTKTYFEQVPLEVAKKAAMQERGSARAVACIICRIPVRLEDCKIDHNGAAVHEKCYLEKLSRARLA